MIQKIIFTFLVIVTFQSYSQDLKVLISEKKSGKRLVLFAENKTKDTVQVFLMVNAEGYRKSASKPVIKKIAPNKKVPMITLIELKDVPSQYTYDLIINEGETDIAISYEKQAKDIEKNILGKLVMFSTTDCEKCSLLSTLLTRDRINHRVFNITENPVIYRQFMAFIERQLTEETKIRFPVIWNKDRVIFGYDDLEVILKELN